jgi:hypothetical protein
MPPTRPRVRGGAHGPSGPLAWAAAWSTATSTRPERRTRPARMTTGLGICASVTGADSDFRPKAEELRPDPWEPASAPSTDTARVGVAQAGRKPHRRRGFGPPPGRPCAASLRAKHSSDCAGRGQRVELWEKGRKEFQRPEGRPAGPCRGSHSAPTSVVEARDRVHEARRGISCRSPFKLCPLRLRRAR